MVENRNIVPEWVWVLAEIDGNKLFAQEIVEHKRKFIPAFQSKEDAVLNAKQLLGSEYEKYQVEAIRINEVSKSAIKHDADIMILDKNGRIVETLTPEWE